MDTLSQTINEALYGQGFFRGHDALFEIQDRIGDILKFNSKCIYSDLKYSPSISTFDSNDFLTLEILRAIRFWGFPLSLHEGWAYMPFYSDLDYTLNYRKDKIWKLTDLENGFTCEFRLDKSGVNYQVYILFFKQEVLRQGNFYAFKSFVLNKIKPVFFDFLQYSSLLGRAIYSTNSEIRFSRQGDWRLYERIWTDPSSGLEYKVSGLKYLYLKMGFQLGELVDPALEPQKDYIVLINKNI